MAIKLKPCSFCGGEGYFRTPVKISVYCLDDWEKKYYAIAKYWNRRANEQDEWSEIH